MTTRFPCLNIEGGLFAADLIDQIADGTAQGQKPADFKLSPRTYLTDEIAAAWTDARSLWTAFQHRLERLSPEDTATSTTRDQWMIPLLSLLNYELTYVSRAAEVDGQTYAISHRAGQDENAPPVHIVGCRQSLDRRPESGRPRLAPHSLLQEYINRTEHLWGIVTNGYTLRLLRDSQLIRRQAYIEFDIRQMMESEKFSDFALLFRLVHRSRLPLGMEDASECLLEKYHKTTVEQGGRVRDRLRDGVEEAIKILANGFLRHQRNEDLRERVKDGKLSPHSFYQQLLRLIYRFLFLMVAEERNLITENLVYRDYYSISRLRRLAEVRSSYSGHEDLWLGLQTTFRLFQDEKLSEMFGAPPLNGDLFNTSQTPDLQAISISNREFLTALWNLSMYRENEKTPWRRINYAALDVEELGSVYESLLDFQPIFLERNGKPTFDLAFGMERKSTGSYYTPPELVNELIKTALVPVLEERLKEAKTLQDKEKAILNLKVCDPASGSGHFLLAAARRLGRELAKIRTGDDEPAPEQMRLAIRDVITHSIYGVDKNPLAVDLCKVALWMEGHSKGKPLTFLDHRIRCGDSLIGVLDLKVLEQGLPDETFDPVTGDDKQVARSLKKQNRSEREGQHSLPFEAKKEITSLLGAYQPLRELPDDTPEQIRRKVEAYQKIQSHGSKWWQDNTACHLWTAAFFAELTQENNKNNRIPTTETLRRYLETHAIDGRQIGNAWALAQKHHFFHWPLEFPEVFAYGGFDVVLGNPPWDVWQPEEIKFFAISAPEVSQLQGEKRKRAIESLNSTNPILYTEWEAHKRFFANGVKFMRNSRRFLQCEKGKLNTYAVFSELARQLIHPCGRAGIVVPTGIATDHTNKPFFSSLIGDNTLVSLYGFENKEGLFPGVHRQYRFCLLSIIGSGLEKKIPTEFLFFATKLEDLKDEDRKFTLLDRDFELFSPNTRTCPVFRTHQDAELTRKIFHIAPVLVNEAIGANPWRVELRQGLFNMTSDSHFFRTEEHLKAHGFGLYGNLFLKEEDFYLPLYEAKMIWLFDHRYGTYAGVNPHTRDVHLPNPGTSKLSESHFVVLPRYWVHGKVIIERMQEKWGRQYCLVYRRIAGATDERASISAIVPLVGLSDGMPIVMAQVNSALLACLCSNFNALVFDYSLRQKLGRIHVDFHLFKQLPVLEPSAYKERDIPLIVARVLELTYTAWDIKTFPDDVWRDADEEVRAIIRKQWEENQAITGGHEWNPPEWAEIAEDGIPLPPFKWDENRRAILRAELDAYYAKLYGLNRKQLRYILDPADLTEKEIKDILDPLEEVKDPLDPEAYARRVEKSTFPGETFRVLKEKEIRQFGEYRTRRLVLEEWDRLEAGRKA